MKKTIILLCIAALLIIVPFIINANGEYEGADAQAEGIINEINSEYEPWANSLWEPPSGEVESFIFAAQAALGAGFIGYFVGNKRNDKRNKSVQH
ncbi:MULTISPECIES: energy-coupling factor ABC transporter substrate-binding protein [unclassified Clostridium]|uniref:energy-coupling factor ABC transporter substrate-binding protein n=1 Tax=Clostridium TaxID=1485 RepID=UPI001C8C3F9C|nr:MULTISPECIES: energy-coupling factor ABC transporter substrate-binding protein [unclassified Clostridium]MBX9138585.1 energy-coupling factor ABC transporter substrate-binding protein [Clostridium sp. K12(2020)]MBX9145343.1 energy-coupling factor ABC transporter substrate-binding protein [Clostridium sp. K13]MDU2290006.1 energy-coupling factor ABC transporter substrate-binding protein [Clostridium celatum]MDU4325125.1 energy-coupling factor ABC transporter substrate-binding protein [Clostridi